MSPLTDLDLADIGFVDIDPQLHVPQVLGDDEQHRRLQRGSHDLAGIDIARQNDAVDRRTDASLDKIDLVQPQVGFGHLDIGEGARMRRERPIIGGLGEVEILC